MKTLLKKLLTIYKTLKMFNKITLNLQEKSYEIIVGKNTLEHLNLFLEEKKYNKIHNILNLNNIC